MKLRPRPGSAEATGMPEEKHSTGTQKQDDLMTVVLSLLMMPSPRSITSLPADRHLAEHPFGYLQNCLKYSICLASGSIPTTKQPLRFPFLFRIPVAMG